MSTSLLPRERDASRIYYCVVGAVEPDFVEHVVACYDTIDEASAAADELRLEARLMGREAHYWVDKRVRW